MLKAVSATQKQVDLVKLHEQAKRNLEEEIQNYKDEAQKQRKIIFQLEKERDRYINEASDLTQRVSHASVAAGSARAVLHVWSPQTVEVCSNVCLWLAFRFTSCSRADPGPNCRMEFHAPVLSRLSLSFVPSPCGFFLFPAALLCSGTPTPTPKFGDIMFLALS